MDYSGGTGPGWTFREGQCRRTNGAVVCHAFDRGRYYALMGDRERALDELNRAAQFGYWDFRNPRDDLRSLFGDPEFEAIVAEVKKRIGEE